MNYQVSRAGQMYGPYTIEDIQRYVGLGNTSCPAISPRAKRCRSGFQWRSCWARPSRCRFQTLRSILLPIPSTALPAAYPASALSYPDPPNLHWLLVMLFGLVTCRHLYRGVEPDALCMGPPCTAHQQSIDTLYHLLCHRAGEYHSFDRQ